MHVSEISAFTVVQICGKGFLLVSFFIILFLFCLALPARLPPFSISKNYLHYFSDPACLGMLLLSVGNRKSLLSNY